jgi:hypothetical protein
VLATRAVIGAALATVTALLIALALDALVGLSAPARRLLAVFPWMVGLSVLALLGARAYAAAQRATDESVALWFERRIPSLRYALVTRLSTESDGVARLALDRAIAEAPLEQQVAVAARASLTTPMLALLSALVLLALMPAGAVGRAIAPTPGDALDRRVPPLQPCAIRSAPSWCACNRPRTQGWRHRRSMIRRLCAHLLGAV